MKAFPIQGSHSNQQVKGAVTHLDEKTTSEKPLPWIVVVILIPTVEEARPQVSRRYYPARSKVPTDPDTL